MGPLTGQWADTLLAAEQLRQLQLTVWALSGILVATAVIALLKARRVASPLLSQFAIQGIVWGLLELAFVALSSSHLELRDLRSAVSLDRTLWLAIGLEAGIVAVGATLIVFGWRLGNRLGLMGAGLGVVLQGVALAVIDLQLAAAIVR